MKPISDSWAAMLWFCVFACMTGLGLLIGEMVLASTSVICMQVWLAAQWVAAQGKGEEP